MNDADIFAPLHRPLSDRDRAAILFMAEDKHPLVEIAGAVGRGVGTVSTTIFSMRRDGLLPASGRGVG
jgi:predicted transcriptional regulator